MFYAEIKMKKRIGNVRNSEHEHISHLGPAAYLHLMPNHTQTTMSVKDYRENRSKNIYQQ